jgi:hypothetical protein
MSAAWNKVDLIIHSLKQQQQQQKFFTVKYDTEED